MPRTEYTGSLRPRITYMGRTLEKITNLDVAMIAVSSVTEEDLVANPGKVPKDNFKIEWFEDNNPSLVIWTETAKVLPGVSFVPQITCYGKYEPIGSMFIDNEDKRHFVLNPEVGSMGAPFGNAKVEIGG